MFSLLIATLETLKDEGVHWISMIELITGFSVIMLSICFMLVIAYPLKWLTAKNELIALFSGFAVVKMAMFLGIVIDPPVSEILNILALPIVLLLGPLTAGFTDSTLHLRTANVITKKKSALLIFGLFLMIPLLLNSLSLEVLAGSKWLATSIEVSLGLFFLTYLISSSRYFVPMLWNLMRGSLYGVGYSEDTYNWFKGVWLSMSMTWLIILADLTMSIFYYEPADNNAVFSILYSVPPLHSVIFSILDLVIWLILLGFTTAYCQKPRGQEEREACENVKKYRTSALTENKAEIIIRDLNAIMKRENYFLDSTLSLEKIAKKINIQPQYLSQSINQYCGMSFYEYLASFRIEYAKNELLQHPKKNILDVAMQSGFNAKSTFNLTFKKYTGLTPSDFRKQNRDSN